MALLKPDLSIDTTARPDLPATIGVTGRGHITTSVRHLRDRLGPPDDQLVSDHDTEVWALHTPAGLAQLWSVPTAQHDVDHQMLILADTDDVLPWVYAGVHGSTAAFPSAALDHFTEATLHGFGNAYRDYLYLRMHAEERRRDRLDRTAPDFRTHLHRPRQINTMLLQLAEILHHYEWAHASTIEREEWSHMPRPTPSEGLRYWKARNRWLYPPAVYPFHGNPDLPGMLRNLADNARENRDSLLELAPEMDLVLHDEHEQTVRALADIPIPGLDALLFARG